MRRLGGRRTYGPRATLLLLAMVALALSVPAGPARAAPAIPTSWSRVPSANMLGSNTDTNQHVGAGSASGISSSLGRGGLAQLRQPARLGGARGIVGQPTSAGGAKSGRQPIGLGGKPNHQPFGAGGIPPYNSLSAVAAISSSDVWAVGSSSPGGGTNSQALAEHWNGTAWSVVPAASVNGGADYSLLNGVAAAATNDVWAVGEYYDPNASTPYQTLTEHWNGTAWSVVPSPNVNGTTDSNDLSAVVAISSSNVWAVGEHYNPNASTVISQTLIEHWNGTTWSVISSPNAGGSTNSNVLLGAAAISASDVWAVGDYYNPTTNTPDQTLIEQWNGTSWSIVSSANVGGTADGNGLSSVAAVSASDVWAVGSYYDPIAGTPDQTLIEQWNGTVWSVVSSPNVGGTADGNDLYGVATVSSSDVWAVGSYYMNTSPYDVQTLVEQWNGTSWSIISSPNVSGTLDELMGVAVVSSSDVWAVGQWGSAHGFTLVEHWNGTSWSVSPSPNVVGWQDSNGLSAVAAVSSSNVWAVGGYYDPMSGTNPTLIEHWNGASWSVASSPNAGAANASNSLNAVAADAANDVWAVGNYYDQSTSISQTLIEHWNGTAWSIVPSPNAGGTTDTNYLYAVTALASNNIWAVGNYTVSTTGIDQTLIEHWNGTAWSVVPSPNVNGTADFNYLSGVAAVSATDVWAVGYYFDPTTNTPTQTLIEQWNGSAWSIVPSPDAGGTADYNYLSSVTATSASSAWAVGYYYDPNTFIDQTLTEQWNGTAWSVVSSPDVGGTTDANDLFSVAATAANDMWAVGDYQVSTSTPSYELTLIEHWNGTSWSIMSSPNGSSFNGLTGVAVLSTNSVWAVGSYEDMTNFISKTLTERYGYLIASSAPGAMRSTLGRSIR